MRMTRKLLIALATTVALVGPAAAGDRNQFAPEVLGLWCAQEGHNALAPRSTSYYREDCEVQGNQFILKPKEIESAGLAFVAAASSAGDALLLGLPARMGLSPGLFFLKICP